MKKKQKNPFARSAKKSNYKTLQLLECFARDLSVQETVRLTKMSEPTVRDRFSEIRGKLLKWVLDYPDRFNGFGHLLMDATGTINLNLLELLFYYSESDVFKQRMAQRYPRFRTQKDPALPHVIEVALRRFTSVELPEVNANFFEFVKKAFSSSKTEAYLKSMVHKPPAFKARLLYWQTAERRIRDQDDYRVRRFAMADGEAFFRDLKYCLRQDPL